MSFEKYLLITHIQTALSAIVAILCFIRFKSRDRIVRLIGMVFLTSFLANMASLFFANFGLRYFINAPHVIYLVVSFYLLTRMYHLAFKAINMKWVVLITCVFLSFTLLNIFVIQTTLLNSYANILYSSILIIYCLLYFYVLIRDLPSLYVHHLPMFWFNSALLIFHAGAFFLFSFTSYLVHVLKDDLLIYWSFHNILSVIEHFIVMIGLYYDLKLLNAKRLRQLSN
jgi:hypothetical protein